MLLIPDISEWQPGTSMAGIKSQNGGVAIIRACYGSSHTDKVFSKLRADAHKAGFRALGIYHYVTSSSDMTTQANFFIRTVGKLQPGEFAILDLEEGSGNQASRAKTWLSRVDSQLGGKAWLYSGESFYNTRGLKAATTGRNVWIAAYGSNEPSVPHTLWQCTDGKIGPHITSWSGAGKCDTSVHNGTVDSFVKAIGGAAVAPDAEETAMYVSLTTSKPMNLKANQQDTVNWDKTIEGEHKGGHGVIPIDPAIAVVQVTSSVPFWLSAYDSEKDEYRDLGSEPTSVVALGAGEYLYVALKSTTDFTITPYVKAVFWEPA